MKYGRIYKITNQITGQSYIGQTTRSIVERFQEHCLEKRNRYLSNAIRRYTKNNFQVETLIEVDNQIELNTYELFFVNYYQTLYPNGYNHRAGGNQKGICSELTRQKISQSKKNKSIQLLKNRSISTAQRLQISKSLGGQFIIGIKDHHMIIFATAHSTKTCGHNPSNIVQICQQKSGRRKSLGYEFFYLKNYANQSGSSINNIFEHAQRIGFETTDNVE